MSTTQESTIVENAPSKETPLLINDPGDESIEDHPFELIDYDWLLRENKMITCKQNGTGYFMGASNGWCRLFTLKARQYWIAQAITHHRAPDWKIHFSIRLSDVPKAFNLIAQQYLDAGYRFGLKCMLLRENWPDHMKGREITIYLYRYYDLNRYRTIREYVGNGLFVNHSIDDPNDFYSSTNLMEFNNVTSNPFDTFELSKDDEEDLSFYRPWIEKVEQILSENGIETNDGCAKGDLPIGKYSSLRNEAFVPCSHLRPDAYDLDEKFIYPPNDAGWNAAGHDPTSLRESGLCVSNTSFSWNGIMFAALIAALIVSNLVADK